MQNEKKLGGKAIQGKIFEAKERGGSREASLASSPLEPLLLQSSHLTTNLFVYSN
jgi:hypothetical protein